MGEQLVAETLNATLTTPPSAPSAPRQRRNGAGAGRVAALPRGGDAASGSDTTEDNGNESPPIAVTRPRRRPTPNPCERTAGA